MRAESVIRSTVRLTPRFVIERIIGAWTSEPSTQERLLKEFDDAPAYILQLAYDKNVAAKVVSGKQEGYFLHKVEDGINLHFSPLAIIQRQDLISKVNDITTLSCTGFISFDPNAGELFHGRRLGMLPLFVKYKGQQVDLFDLLPEYGLTLQARGFNDERVFYNSTLFLRHIASEEKFVVKFAAPGARQRNESF